MVGLSSQHWGISPPQKMSLLTLVLLALGPETSTTSFAPSPSTPQPLNPSVSQCPRPLAARFVPFAFLSHSGPHFRSISASPPTCCRAVDLGIIQRGSWINGIPRVGALGFGGGVSGTRVKNHGLLSGETRLGIGNLWFGVRGAQLEVGRLEFLLGISGSPVRALQTGLRCLRAVDDPGTPVRGPNQPSASDRRTSAPRRPGPSDSQSPNQSVPQSPSPSEPQPTWTYTPYQPPKQRKQAFRSGKQTHQRRPLEVPKSLDIPEDEVELTFVRSSGSGGQNVNKLSTKVELRFHVMRAKWLPHEVRVRVSERERNRINKEGFLILTSQDHRTQTQNRKEALQKLEFLILEAYPRPKERTLRKGPSKAAKRRNVEDKRKRSQVKQNRRTVDF